MPSIKETDGTDRNDGTRTPQSPALTSEVQLPDKEAPCGRRGRPGAAGGPLTRPPLRRRPHPRGLPARGNPPEAPAHSLPSTEPVPARGQAGWSIQWDAWNHIEMIPECAPPRLPTPVLIGVSLSPPDSELCVTYILSEEGTCRNRGVDHGECSNSQCRIIGWSVRQAVWGAHREASDSSPGADKHLAGLGRAPEMSRQSAEAVGPGRGQAPALRARTSGVRRNVLLPATPADEPPSSGPGPSEVPCHWCKDLGHR